MNALMKALKSSVKAVVLVIGFIYACPTLASQSPDMDRQIAAEQVVHSETYKFSDGDGEYQGEAPKKWDAHAVAWESCVNHKVAAYEASRGHTPDVDTADMFIDACVNK